MSQPECDISSRDFSVSRLFSIFWEYRSRSRKFWSQKKVSVSVSKIFSLEEKSRYRSRKYLVSKKSLSIGLENIWSQKKVLVSVSKILVLKKSLGVGLDEIFWSRHSVLITRLHSPTYSQQLSRLPIDGAAAEEIEIWQKWHFLKTSEIE